MMSGQADTLYLPIWISVLVLNLNQNSGFGQTLTVWHYESYSAILSNANNL